MMSVREGVNLQFYGRPLPARSLLLDDSVPPPAAASALYAALDALMDWASSLPAPAGFLTSRCAAVSGTVRRNKAPVPTFIGSCHRSCNPLHACPS